MLEIIQDGILSYECVCLPGYAGQYCEIPPMMDMEYQKTDACQQSTCGQVGSFFVDILNVFIFYRVNVSPMQIHLSSSASAMKVSVVQVVTDRLLLDSSLQGLI